MASWLVTLLGVYAALGIAFAVPFAIRGVGRIDEAAKEGSKGFRVLIVPGVAALWPLFFRRWLRSLPPPEEDNPHRKAVKKKEPR